MSAKNKLLFTYIRNCVKESLAFDNDEQLLRLSDKEIDLLSWNAAFNCLSGMMKDFKHLLPQDNLTSRTKSEEIKPIRDAHCATIYEVTKQK